MGKKIDLTGKVFGKLTIVKEGSRQNGHIMWETKCSCGNIKTVRGVDVRQGKIVSCGCVRTANKIAENKSRKGRGKRQLEKLKQN